MPRASTALDVIPFNCVVYILNVFAVAVVAGVFGVATESAC